MRSPVVLLLLLAFAAFAFPARATAQLRDENAVDPAALRIVENLNREILRIQKQRATLDRAAEAELSRLFDPITNFQEIAIRILEPYAAGWTIGEWRTLARALAPVLRTDSPWALRPYRVDRFELAGTGTIFRTVVVNLKAHHGPESVPVSYHLERENGVWSLVNYIVDGIDLVERYQEHYEPLFEGGFLQPILDQLERDVATHPSKP